MVSDVVSELLRILDDERADSLDIKLANLLQLGIGVSKAFREGVAHLADVANQQLAIRKIVLQSIDDCQSQLFT